MTDYTGKRIGQYTLIRKLGEGGMGQVYLARQESMNREVVVKFIVDRAAKVAEFAERFEREVQICASLDHAHIIKVFDYGKSLQQAAGYLVMEYLKGGSLADLIRKKPPLSLDVVANLLEQIASALDYAHGKGIIHRDLKPMNVLLDEGGNAYIGDFGLAKLCNAPTLTRTGTALGTAHYMAPELWRGTPSADHRVDIYALGIMLYEMLTGKVPFDGESAATIMYRHLEEMLPSISEKRADVSPDVQAVVSSLLAKNREQRFQSGRDAATAFHRTLGRQHLRSHEKVPQDEPTKAEVCDVGPVFDGKATKRITFANLPNIRRQLTLVCNTERPGSEVSQLAFSDDGRRISVSCGDEVFIWDLCNQSKVFHVNAFPQFSTRSDRYNPLCRITDIAFSPGGTYLACIASVMHGEVGLPREFYSSILVWDTTTGRKLVDEIAGSGPLQKPKIQFAPNGNILAVSDGSMSVKIFDTRSGRRTQTISQPLTRGRIKISHLSKPVFSPDSSKLILGHFDDTENIVGTISVWDVCQGTKLTVARGQSGGPIEYLYAMPSGNQVLAIDSLRDVWLLDLRSGELAPYFDIKNPRDAQLEDAAFEIGGKHLVIIDRALGGATGSEYAALVMTLKSTSTDAETKGQEHPALSDKSHLYPVGLELAQADLDKRRNLPQLLSHEIVPSESSIIHVGEDGLVMIFVRDSRALVALQAGSRSGANAIPAYKATISQDATWLAKVESARLNAVELWCS